jgi:hypothetical protein
MKTNVIAIRKDFKREQVSADRGYLYLFSDNAARTSGRNQNGECWYNELYDVQSCYPNVTQAVIRGLPNAFPITTMVNQYRIQWTDEMVIRYRLIIESEIDHIRTSLPDYEGLKYYSARPFGDSTISRMRYTAPECWKLLNSGLRKLGILQMPV